MVEAANASQAVRRAADSRSLASFRDTPAGRFIDGIESLNRRRPPPSILSIFRLT